MSVIVTGGGNQEMKVTVIGSARRRVPRARVVLAPRENFLALLGCELPPDVARRGHDQRYGVPLSAGGASVRSSGVKFFDVIVLACTAQPEGGTPYSL